MKKHSMTELFGKNLESPSLKVDIGKKLREYGFTLLGGTNEKIPGNPKVGTLSIIKQIHNDYQDPYKLMREYPEKYKELIAYQKAIYMELKRQEVGDIFLEGVQSIHLTNGDWERTLKTLKEAIEDPDMRDKVFAHYGGGIIYLIEHPLARVHHTESADILKKMSKYRVEDIPEWLVEKREDYAIGQVQAFFTKNPGKKATLIYGSMHDFRDNLRRVYPTNQPQGELISFPDIARRYIEKE